VYLIAFCLFGAHAVGQRARGSRTTKEPSMIMRFDPFREFDRLTEQLASTASRAPRAFPMDAYRRGDQFIVEFDLPGVEPASIELTVEQNALTVRAERRFEPREGDEVLVAERPQGTYARQIFLGDALDSERVQADCRLGVLTLTIPVAETAKPRQVPVGGGQETETIVPPPAGGPAASPSERPASTAGQAAPNGKS
jgi:HSP20 family protein